MARIGNKSKPSRGGNERRNSAAEGGGLWYRPMLLNLAADLLLLGGAILLAWVVVAGLQRLPVFPLRQIEVVSPLEQVTRQHIEHAARTAITGNFFTVNLASARENFERLPWVRNADVRRRWPDTVVLMLEEHRAVARWTPLEGEQRLVNDLGEVFIATSTQMLPVFAGPEGSAPRVLQRYAEFTKGLAPLGRQPVAVKLSSREAWQLRLEIPLAARGGDVVARLAGAEVDYDSFHLGPIELQVSFGDRIAIVGHNGSGKSTLIGSLLGRIPLSSGSQWMGPGVVIGELEQARNQLAGRNEDGTFSDATLLEVFMAATGLLVPEARTLLAKFNLAADHVNRPAASLSPGERTRGVLALLMANGANCLVLDEPTNHLDLPAIEQLEQALETFGGTVLLVTHDRSLLDSVRITRTVTLEAGRIVSDLAT